ncbi:putative membrane protein DUF2207 [Kribbella antiqua]|uniref:Putative membrane protein DUF2207 n=1 Tax=Kribbella antiqua TaxID=2512217 RepID=A0A4R2J541_9ACTN|nr:DUF2207 domain-containing protein [Kribbella antiqua]TCO51399.1 putative membrane protein DUF2207 [Kribbella antiqua]
MRRALFTVVTMLVAALALLGFAVPASAAPGDVVKSFKIDYTVTPDGVLKVQETILYAFASYGRHGIYRDLIIREPYADHDSEDQKYDVSNISVSSPDAPDQFTTETTKKNAQRDQILRIKIGSEDETVGDQATYTIKYDVRGALRHFADHSELYWDATGSSWDAEIDQVTVNVAVPDGVQQVQCFAGPAGSTAACPQKAVSGGKGVFSATDLSAGEQLTIVAGIKAGVVSNDAPIVVDPPSLLERAGLNVPGLAAAGGVTVAAIVGAVLYSKNGNRDLRFAGQPPGTFPPTGVAAQPVKDDLDEDQIPVAFAPPKIPVAEGGLLIDSKVSTTETAATLIDLAVRRGVRIDNTGNDQKAVLLDARAATAPHEQALLSGLFPSLQPGEEIVLRRAPVGDHSMRRAHDGMLKALKDQVKQRGWYQRLPSAIGKPTGGIGCGCVGVLTVLVIIATGVLGGITKSPGPIVMVLLPGIAVVVALGIWVGKKGKGQRNPAGRAVADQVIGFRKYLATAEADQLRFEEGEDIFSKYLPWAIAFGLADRWQKVCAQLVAAGRIPEDPYWYTGPSYYTSGWTAGALSSTVAHTFDPPPAPASSGSGGGSSSGFSSGSSGGGGGGGGGGSW